MEWSRVVPPRVNHQASGEREGVWSELVGKCGASCFCSEPLFKWQSIN